MTIVDIDLAVQYLESIDRTELELWCVDAYEEVFGTVPGKWLCKYSSEKLIAWFLMFYEWDAIANEWVMTPESDTFAQLSSD